MLLVHAVVTLNIQTAAPGLAPAAAAAAAARLKYAVHEKLTPQMLLEHAVVTRNV
jgi:hypothetical protein